MSTFDYTYAERQRDIAAGLYNPLVIADVIDDLDVSISDEAAGVITVTCAVVDSDGNNIAKQHKLQMVLFTDDTYATLDAAHVDVTYAATTGVKLPWYTNVNADFYFLTDENGDLVFTITNGSPGGETSAMGFFFANGLFVPGGEFLFSGP